MGAPITQTVLAYLEAEDWPIEVVEEGVYHTGFSGDSGKWFCVALANDEDEQAAFYSLCPLEVGPERRAAMAEALTLANYGLTIGNFEMDWSDGEVRFKTSIDVSDSELTMEMFRNMVQINVLTVDDYLPALQSVARGADPSTAIRSVEGDAESDGA